MMWSVIERSRVMPHPVGEEGVALEQLLRQGRAVEQSVPFRTQRLERLACRHDLDAMRKLMARPVGRASPLAAAPAASMPSVLTRRRAYRR